MTGYRVDVAGARAVADRTAAAAPTGGALRDAFGEAVAALAGDDVVGPAASRFAAARHEVPERVCARVTEVIDTAAAVTALILAGDTAMADDTTAAAAAVAPVTAPYGRFGRMQ